MPAPPPILDARTLQDILRRLRELAATTAPEWRPAEDDAGTMLQRIFARLLELALQRLNQVPEKNLLAFLDTMGVTLLPPSPAKAPLTFALTAGTPPMLVPQGMQAGTQPSPQQPAVIFETEDDLTVSPAQLAMAFTMDPTWDRYTDQTPVLGGDKPLGFTPFVGTQPLPHVLYLGEDVLLGFAKATVDLDVQWQPATTSLAEVRTFLQRLTWQYTQNGQPKQLTPMIPASTAPIIRFPTIEAIDRTLVQGVSAGQDLRQGLQSRWLRAALAIPFPDDRLAQALRLTQLKLTVRASELRPDLAFSNTAPLDVTKDFLPFGIAPTVGDAFALAHEEAFAKVGAGVTLHFTIRPLPPPTLLWEYFDAELKQWQPIINAADKAAGFTRDGSFVGFAFRMGSTTINGVNAFWVRVRLVDGGYNRPPKMRVFLIIAKDGSTRPPAVGFANQTPIVFEAGFLPFGEKPGPADIFYFGEPQGFPVTIVGDRTISMIAVPDIRLDDGADVPPPADLRWEYLGDSGWAAIPDVQDTTAAFRQSGTVTFTMPHAARREVNGQANYWLRARIAGGDYGRAVEFVPVDPSDPKQGFMVRPGTGNLRPPQIQALTFDYTLQRTPSVITQNGLLYSNQSSANTATGFTPFVSVQSLTPNTYADVEPSFYLGFDAAFPEQPVVLYVAAAPRAFAGSVSKDTRAAAAPSSALPPLQWEYFNGTAWSELAVFDATNHLTASGTVEFLTPVDMAPLAKFNLTARHWIRARSAENDPFDTQQQLGVFLNTVPAVQAVTVPDEILGSSNGLSNQRLRFTRAPVLPGPQLMVREPEPPSDQERQGIELEEGADAIQERLNPVTGASDIWVRWHEVANFLRSDLRSRHYTLDHTTGFVAFGDGKRGLIPPSGTDNISATYRAGGGTAGNRGRAEVAQVKSPLPGIAGVTNPVAADGGAAAETVAMVLERGPQTLKHRHRAVACGDLEWLARQAAGTRVARAICLPNVNRDLRFEPGWVTLIVVPQGGEPKLSPTSELIREVEDYLEARAFIGLAQQTPARVNVLGPGYIRVSVVAEVVPQDIDEAQRVKQRVVDALNLFLHALTGGPSGTGWDFGRDVYASEVSQVIEGVAGVNHVNTLRVRANVAQRRLLFTSAPMAVMDLPEGSAVLAADRQKAALLAELVPAGATVEGVAVKGFKEGDRLTKVHDLTVQAVSGTSITVQTFISDAVGFPRGSRLTTFDGVLHTRLQSPIPRGETVTHLDVEDMVFAEQLGAGDVLTVFYPFPMIVTAVTFEEATINGAATPVQTLGIQSHEVEVALPAPSLLATLDNRVRMPVVALVTADQTTKAVQVLDFQKGDVLTIARRDGAAPPLEAMIRDVQPVDDIVYLDSNFLVYSGAHQITIVAE